MQRGNTFQSAPCWAVQGKQQAFQSEPSWVVQGKQQANVLHCSARAQSRRCTQHHVCTMHAWEKARMQVTSELAGLWVSRDRIRPGAETGQSCPQVRRSKGAQRNVPHMFSAHWPARRQNTVASFSMTAVQIPISPAAVPVVGSPCAHLCNGKVGLMLELLQSCRRLAAGIVIHPSTRSPPLACMAITTIVPAAI